MDTSETYIKRADQPEIQDGWEPKQGDLFWVNEDSGHYKPRVIVVHYDYHVPPRKPNIDGWQEWAKEGGNKLVFLPRLDQLIAMLPEDCWWLLLSERKTSGIYYRFEISYVDDKTEWWWIGDTPEQAVIQGVIHITCR